MTPLQRQRLDELKSICKCAATCATCGDLSSDGDGYEYNGHWDICSKYEDIHVDNPRFPFNTEQPCWSPNFWIAFNDEIDCSSEAQLIQACDGFWAKINPIEAKYPEGTAER